MKCNYYKVVIITFLFICKYVIHVSNLIDYSAVTEGLR